jgi:hypothetical protein
MDVQGKLGKDAGSEVCQLPIDGIDNRPAHERPRTQPSAAMRVYASDWRITGRFAAPTSSRRLTGVV